MPATLIACHECDLLQRAVSLPPRAAARCRRCGMVLYRNIPDSLDRTLAFTLGAVLLYVVANVFPIVGLEAQGNRTSTTLFGTVRMLHEQGMTSVAALVFVTTILVPVLQLGALLYLLLPIKLGQIAPGMPQVFRVLQVVRPWGMVEVFLLGTLVSLAKLAHLATLVPGVALWSLAAVMVLLSAAASSFDVHGFWTRLTAAGELRWQSH